MNDSVEFRPAGSDRVLGWASHRGLGFALAPDERWFRDWEPFDTMVAPEHWLAGVTERSPWGTFVVAEAWTATLGVEPIERTIVGFAQVPTRGRRAAMRVGEPFLTRVAFLTSPPPPKVELGDPAWDAHVTTFAASPADAAAAFPTALRELLRRKGFRGHLEVRPGGFVVHHEGFLPTPEHYDATFRMMHRFSQAIR
jgi:hypothetical protein